MNVGLPTTVGMTPSPVSPTDLAASNGKSEVNEADPGSGVEEQPVVSKVRAQDLVRHILDKGQWLETPAVHQGWKIFLQVSHFLSLYDAGADLLLPGYSGLVTLEMPLLLQAGARMFGLGGTRLWSLSAQQEGVRECGCRG